MTPDALSTLLATPDALLSAQWEKVQRWLATRFGRDAVGIEAMLFLAGIQQSGGGYHPKMEKEAKQDTIMAGTWAAFETIGLYRQDADGQWHRTADLPDLDLDAQEKLLRLALVRYFTPFLDAPPHPAPVSTAEPDPFQR